MKPVQQQAELPAAHDDDLVDQFLQGSDYLPDRGDQSWGDQSWREQAALRISAGYEEVDEVETPATFPARDDRLSEASVHEGSGRGGLLIAFFAIAILIPAAVVLTAPGILTADFWRAQRIAAKPSAEQVAPPVRTANIPARVAADEAIPSPTATPPIAKAVPRQTPPLRPTDNARDLNAEPAANAPPRQAAASKQQQAMHTADRDGAADRNEPEAGFGSFVLGADGKMEYRFFPADGSSRTGAAPAAKPTEFAAGKDNDQGFYAMVPGPDGTMRYQHFPSKPER